jgi:CheY-like chemotaxis protein
MTKPFSREAIMVSNGLSCRSLSQNPDLDLLIDMNMPVMGGFEAAKLIREFNNNNNYTNC